MKKLIYLLCLILSLSTVGCGSDDDTTASSDSTGTTALQPDNADCGDSSCL